MKRILPIALFALGFVTADAGATCPRPVTNDDRCRVVSWYHRYLGRDVDPVGMGTWTTELAHRRNAEAGILGSEEYLQRHGGTPEGFVVGLYFEVLSRPPAANEVQNWTCRLRELKCNRVRLAEEFLRASTRELAMRPMAAPAFGPGPMGGPPPDAIFSPGQFSPPPPGRVMIPIR